MHLHGSLETNLSSAVQSARRLRGHPVHAGTLAHWTELIHRSRRELAGGDAGDGILPLVLELETELADRSA